MKKIGYIDARRVNLPSKIDVKSWGMVFYQGYYVYFNNDYSASIASPSASRLLFSTTDGHVDFACGAHGVAVAIDNDGLATAYRLRTTGTLDFGAAHTGTLKLPQRTAPVTQPPEGEVWYNATTKKLQFSTAAGMETVTSV